MSNIKFPDIELPDIELPSMPDLPSVDPSAMLDRAGSTVSRAKYLLPWVDDRPGYRRYLVPAAIAAVVAIAVVVVVKRRKSDAADQSSERDSTSSVRAA